jgi:nucleotide-binding universal stress UspA family protein
MIDLSTIVVPVGHAQDLRAVEFAARLARGGDARVTALHVGRDLAGSAVTAAEIGAAVARIESAPVDFARATADSIEDGIVAAAAGADLVCMSTAATVLPHERHIGSISEGVVRRVGAPVALVGPKAIGAVDDGGRVVVPVDGSERAEAALSPAAAMAAVLGAEVWVVTVVSRSQQEQAGAMLGPDFGVLESAYVRRLARSIGGDAQFEVLHGSDPSAAILDFAHPDGIVVMSTHGRSGPARLFAGSVAMEVVAASTRPVVVLRPRDEVLVTD